MSNSNRHLSAHGVLPKRLPTDGRMHAGPTATGLFATGDMIDARRRPLRAGASGRLRLRRGFTLVELLVVTMIIAILATSMLFALAGASQSAKRQRSRSQVAKVHELIAEKWESYESRSVRIPPQYQTVIQSLPKTERRRQTNQLRLMFLRELMRLEMPDRISDVTANPGNRTPPPNLIANTLNGNTALHRYYLSRISPGWSPEHESAECLHLILSRVELGDGFAIESFPDGEIADTDGDGMLEILDAWGRPLQFVRWPTGYTLSSTYQVGPDAQNARKDGSGQDPFDFTQCDTRLLDNESANDPFMIFPLVLSAGQDGRTNIFPMPEDNIAAIGTNDPYQGLGNSGALMQGAVADQSAGQHFDNITNHALGLTE